MTTPPQPDIPIVVLHVRNSRLARTQCEGLRALGVEVDSMTPGELNDAMSGEAFRDPDERAATIRRITDAHTCVMDEGTGVRLAAVILHLRQHCVGVDYTTIAAIEELGHGMDINQALEGGDANEWLGNLRCRLVARDQVFDIFRGLTRTNQHEPIPQEFDREVRSRPPRPLPFVANPDAFSLAEAEVSPGWMFFRVQSGHTPPRVLLVPSEGRSSVRRCIPAVQVLTLLVMHLPTEELPLFETAEAEYWWTLLIEDLEFPGPGREEREQGIERLIWHAMARDGGKQTLARLPAALSGWRRVVSVAWKSAVRSAEQFMLRGLTSASATTRGETVSAEVLQTWDVVPCEDPLAPEADRDLYRPTLVSLRVARRYRPAPLVLREALDRWGGRPYLEGRVAEQVKQFVKESPPTSREELSDWLRLINTLPDGVLRDLILVSATAWPRAEVPMVNLMSDTEYCLVNPNRIPCFDTNGAIQTGVLATVEDSKRRQWLGNARGDNRNQGPMNAR